MDGIFGSDDSREASSAGSRSASPASSDRSRSPAQRSDDGEQSEHSDAEERSEKSYRSSRGRSAASGDESGYEEKGEEGSGDERGQESGDEGSDESRRVDDQSGDEEAPARTPARTEGHSDASDNEGSGSEVHRSDEEEQRSDVEDHRSDDEDRHSEAAAERSDASGDEGSANEASGNEASANEASANEASANEASANEASANEASDNEASANEASANEASGDEASGDEGSVHSNEDRAPAASGSSSEAESVVGRKRRRSAGSEVGSAASAAEGSDDEAVPGRKRARLSSTEDKGDEAEVEALFGEDLDDLSSDEEGATKKKEAKGEGEDEEEERPVKRMGSDEEGEGEEKQPAEGEEEEVPVPETRIDVEIPRIVTNLGSEVHFVKLPNFLSVDTRPYDPQWYEDEVDEDEVLDEEGRARLKLKVENTVRWRYIYDKMGNPVRQSNARIIKWSDGSMSLHLGSEIFDVHKQSLMQGDHNHLFIRQGTGLQGQAVFRTKLSFRPHSTDSFTHRKMTLSLAGRSQKTQKIRVLPQVGQDPEAHRSEMIKKEEDRLRASIRRENKQRRMREKSHSRGLSSSYLEADEDDAAISLSAIKNKYRRGGSALRERPSIYSSDEDASDMEDQRARRLEKAKGGGENDDDSDLDYFDKKAESKKNRKAIEESDEDDD
ncbi:another transcription unit [Amblyomma americanum]